MKHISEILTAVCNEHGITMNQGDRPMSEVQLIIRIENDEQADKVLAVLNEGEENGELDFSFNVHRRTKHAVPYLQPTFSVGDDGEPMI